MEGSPKGEAVQGPVTGIIRPPPNVRAVVDKTAAFVASKGRKMEETLLGRAKGKKFDFMRPGHPYFRYYDEQVEKLSLEAFRKEVDDEGKKDGVLETDNNKSDEDDGRKDMDEVVSRPAKLVATANAVGKQRGHAPPPLQFTVSHPIGFESPLQIDLIKLMAKYTAVLGNSFVEKIKAEEKDNAQFQFLRSRSRLNRYFTALVAKYKLVLDWQDTLKSVREDFGDRLTILDRAVHRVEYQLEEEEKEREANDQSKAEFVAFNQIDWHEFVLVETIDFDDDDDASSSSSDEGEEEKKSKETQEKKGERKKETNDSGSDVEMDSDDDYDDSDIEIRSDYKPTVKTSDDRETLLTLPDGREINPNDVSKHLKVQLLDPKGKADREKFLEKQKTVAFAENDISKNLKKLASNRPDLFASDLKEETDGKRRKNASVTWDGKAESIAATLVTAEQQHSLPGKPKNEGERFSVGPQPPPRKRKRF